MVGTEGGSGRKVKAPQLADASSLSTRHEGEKAISTSTELELAILPPSIRFVPYSCMPSSSGDFALYLRTLSTLPLRVLSMRRKGQAFQIPVSIVAGNSIFMRTATAVLLKRVMLAIQNGAKQRP